MEDSRNILYKTVEGRCHAETEVERSKFIAHISHVDSREEAESFIKEIKTKYKDATHNVGTFIVGEKQELQWTSDDGEPQGTSGPPILKMITSMGITNIAIVVTRYFGGVKLGTGGLVRAYTGAAKAALLEAGVVGAVIMLSANASMDYSAYNKLTSGSLLDGFEVAICNVEFGEKVTFTVVVSEYDKEKLVSLMDDLTGGKVGMLEFEEKLTYVPVTIK